MSTSSRVQGATMLVVVVFAAISLAFVADALSADRQSIIDTARKYLVHGLVEHKPKLVPLADKAWRVEQGQNTGSSGKEIKRRLLREEYQVITGISDERWLVEGSEAVVFYKLHIKTNDNPLLVSERFKVTNGSIDEIEAVFYRPLLD